MTCGDRQTRTYLEMTTAGELRPGRRTGVSVEYARRDPTDPDVHARYVDVGRPFGWSVASWTPAQWLAFDTDTMLRTFLALADGEQAGIGFLRVAEGGDVEIRAFGLVPAWIGRGIGGSALEALVRLAWAQTGPHETPTRRVWLHTCTADHPSALANYRARGFLPFHTASYVRE